MAVRKSDASRNSRIPTSLRAIFFDEVANRAFLKCYRTVLKLSAGHSVRETILVLLLRAKVEKLPGLRTLLKRRASDGSTQFWEQNFAPGMDSEQERLALAEGGQPNSN